MPTPARGPQTTPPDEGRSSRLPAPTTPRHRSFTCSTTYDGRATRERAKQCSKQHRTLRFSPTTLPRPEPRLLPPQPCSALLCMSTAHRVVASALPVRVRIWSLQPEAEHGHPWARMARPLPRPLHVLPRSTSDARPRLCQLRWIPYRCGKPRGSEISCPYGQPCRCGIPFRSGIPCRNGIPCRCTGKDTTGSMQRAVHDVQRK